MKLDAFSDQLAELGYTNSGERYKLVGLYAYNAFYDADEEYITNVNDGIVVSPNYPISGIYLNQKLEEDTVEIEVAYCLTSPSDFKMKEISAYVSHVANIIANVKERHYISGNLAAESILREYLQPDEEGKIRPFCIHILTNVDLGDNEEYKTHSAVEHMNPGVKGVDISVTVSFGHEIQDVIESNIAPFEFVKEGRLSIDKPQNVMAYGDNAIVVNVSALSLKKLWGKEGNKGLLAMNLRYYVKNVNIDTKIENSIQNDYDEFWYLNNGIIIVCDSFEISGNQLNLKNFSIVNGGQTTRMIGMVPFNNDFYILAKVIKSPEETADKNLFVSKVAEASNTQKPIKAKDVIANRVEQRNLKSDLANERIFIEIKRGEKADKTLYPESWQKTKNNELAQDLYAFVFLQPGPARNNVSKILQDEKKYSMIFQSHHYSTAFLKDVLFLEKAYRKYCTKKTGKNAESIAPEFSGLIKNGMYYCLSVIGYILKLVYCPAYEETLRRYKMTNKKEAIQSEQAFDKAFIDANTSFASFERTAFEMFDYVIEKFVHPRFREARAEKPELAYSNWTKTNTGFSAIVSNIESSRAFGEDYYVEAFANKFFLKPNEAEKDENSRLFTQNCKAILASETDGTDEKAIRDDLMKLRLSCSLEKHLSETRIMTDKMIETIAYEKPTTKEALAKIVKGDTIHFLGDKILEIVKKNTL